MESLNPNIQELVIKQDTHSKATAVCGGNTGQLETVKSSKHL